MAHLVIDTVIDVSFLQGLESVDHCEQFSQVVNLLSLPGVAAQPHLVGYVQILLFLNTDSDLFHQLWPAVARHGGGNI